MGSGGTGVTASAVAVGVVDGFGSVIVNGVRFQTDGAAIETDDVRGLQLGMTVRVSGQIASSLSSGVATNVLSSPEFRGVVTARNLAAQTFTVGGATLSVDDATVWDGVGPLAALGAGASVQVYALPGAAPELWRATRIEAAAPGAPEIFSGVVRNLDASSRTFTLLGWQVSYAGATLTGGLPATALANGLPVNVRAAGPSFGGVVRAAQIRATHALAPQSGSPVAVMGLVSGYTQPQASFMVGNTPVLLGAAPLTGGPASSLGNGVKLEVAGTLSGGVLQASRAKFRQVPGAGGPAQFEVIGTVAQFRSLSDFRVNGQAVDASGPNVEFRNGSAAQLRNGARVTVRGSQVVGGVLQLSLVQFDN